MANPDHVEILKQGVETWNQWREKNPNVQPDLSNTNFRQDFHIYHFQRINLSGVDLTKTIICGDFEDANFSSAILREAEFSVAYLDNADLSNSDLKDSFFEGTTFEGVNLSGADLRNATIVESSISGDTVYYVNLSEVNLSRANLSKMNLHAFDFSKADLSRANLKGADLTWANLSEANLHAANLSGATISWANLSEADLRRANLTGCKIYAISAWNVILDKTTRQKNLIITRDDETTVTVDDLEVAQFIYLLLHNQKVRQVIDTITSKVVLILGRFTEERKMVLDALKDELRYHNYSPVVFDFEEHGSKSFVETARTLANMAHFVLIDLTNLDDALSEILMSLVPHCFVPIQPFLLGNHQHNYALFRDLQQKYRWVLSPLRYKDSSDLLASFQEHIVQPVEDKTTELKQRKPLKIFFGYAHEDRGMLDTLKKHLRLLERSGQIEMWDDRDIDPGSTTDEEIEKQLSDAQLILLLMSPDFIASNDCHTIQEKAMRGKARVIPILLRPCAWKSTPLGQLQVLPRDERPIEKQKLDNIFFEVSEEISSIIKGKV